MAINWFKSIQIKMIHKWTDTTWVNMTCSKFWYNNCYWRQNSTHNRQWRWYSTADGLQLIENIPCIEFFNGLIFKININAYNYIPMQMKIIHTDYIHYSELLVKWCIILTNNRISLLQSNFQLLIYYSLYLIHRIIIIIYSVIKV